MKVKNVKLMNAVLAIHSGPPPSFFVVHYALQGLSFIFYSWFARRITARRSCTGLETVGHTKMKD